ncbi:MAG: CDP-diacylglycerol--glycerol-3-phosphate 3-phosphatidyltransferase [Longicatena sp.]
MNLPNKISVFRIVLVPVIAGLYLFYDGALIDITFNNVRVDITLGSLLVLVLFATASFTDYLDGSIARKRNLVTSFGKFIDPIADKLLVNTMFILFAVSGKISIIPVIIMIWRDMIVDGLRMNASASGKVVAAGMMGKIKTVLQMSTIVFLLLNNMPFAFFNLPITTILLWAAVLVSVASGIDYFIKLKDIVLESM